MIRSCSDDKIRTPYEIHDSKLVDENGKITRLRRECPNEECGAGVFMASHFDRQYCGKCCLTYELYMAITEPVKARNGTKHTIWHVG
uniref:40S ribosomal protein S27a n=1 Tax=Magallana gigas TaxID=29159 RepID=K1QY10_MAGGI